MEDVDLPVLNAFYTAASKDTRFRKEAIEDWEYTSSSGITIHLCVNRIPPSTQNSRLLGMYFIAMK